MSQETSERGFLDRSARKRVSGRLNRLYSSRSGNIKEDDLSTARSKLDNILDRISRGEETFDDDYFDDVPFGMNSPIKSKRSRVPRKTAKKPREDEYSKSSSFILRLFDRTVDLSDFCTKYSDTDPPLYPICRAWARNCDLSNEQDSVDEDQTAATDLEAMGIGDPDKPIGLYVLPPPDPKPSDDNGNEMDLRLPKSSTIKKGLCTNLIDKSLNSMTDKNREALLDASLSRWRTIRQEWREASFLNQERYRPSFTVIQALSNVPSQALDEEMLSNM